jgi:hypothetical protein
MLLPFHLNNGIRALVSPPVKQAEDFINVEIGSDVIGIYWLFATDYILM